MKTWISVALVLAAVGGLLGFLGAATGVVPIAASSGHFAITEWVLKFSMRRSVATHSATISVPENLDDRALVVRGAGHYEHGCRFCHGAPGTKMPAVLAAATPHPPRLDQPARELDPEDLFYVVKHGVKFTGMPAWPTQQRDDEVWAVVAFLLALPELDAAGYRELVHPTGPSPGTAPEIVVEACARCHGIDGQGTIPGAFPRLAGQRPSYLLASLQAYAGGRRPSGIMSPIAVDMTHEQMRIAVDYYASLPAMKGRQDRQEPIATRSHQRGAKVAAEGIPDRNVPACAQCHGPTEQPRNPAYPQLAGQDARYLELQLQLFRSGQRGGSRFSELMDEVASHELDDDIIEVVAAHYEQLQ